LKKSIPVKKYIFIMFPILILGFFILLISKKKGPDYIFLITLDTTRADYINHSLSENNHTKHFAGLASEGIYFKNAYALIPITLPSHASIFYSLPPHILKVYNNGQQFKVPHPSFVQSLKRAGYRTGAVVSLGVLKSKYGLNVGFDEYRDDFSLSRWYKTAEEVNQESFKLIDKFSKEKTFLWIHYSDPHSPYFPPKYYGNIKGRLNMQEIFKFTKINEIQVNIKSQLIPGKNIIDLEIDIPDAIRESKLIKLKNFIFLDFKIIPEKSEEKIEIIFPTRWDKKSNQQKTHYFSIDPFSQIVVKNNSKGKLNISISFKFRIELNYGSRKFLYGEEVRYMDEKFGELLKFLKQKGIYKKSFFIVMGDHGEGLGEQHHFFGHIHYLNKLYSRVPLIIAGRGVKGKGPRLELVSNLNVAPTLMDIANLKKFDYMLGDSLLKKIKPKKLLLETYSPEAHHDAYSLIDFPFQVIFYTTKRKNKLEFFNLENDKLGLINIIEEETSKHKAELINLILKISKNLTQSRGKMGKISPEDRQMLKSLGYL